MNNYNDYTLHSILNVIGARKKFVIRTTLLVIVAGLAAYFVFPRKYKAETIFILKSPYLTDRGNIYGSAGNANNYFADEDNISKLISMSESDSFHAKLINGLALDKVYDLNVQDQEELIKLKKTISKRLQIYRAENSNIVLLYFDKNPQLAAKVANYSIPLLDVAMRRFYTGISNDQITALRDKIAEQDSTINKLTDTLVKLREEYGIYDIINPARHNIMSGSMKNSGKPGFARGIELIQNIESVKDEMVASKATNTTLLGQYTTGNKLKDLPLANVIKIARPPLQPVLPLPIVLVISAIVGLLFSVIFVLVAHSLNSNK